MNYFSEQDIRSIVAAVLAERGEGAAAPCCAEEIPVEISARHVHLTHEAVEQLFGKGYQLTKKRELSQPGEFLSGERVKLVTPRGELANVAVLGPERAAVQVEISATDNRTLGIHAPVCLSGDLEGGEDMLIVGPQGILQARECTIVAQAHVHMTPADAAHYRVHDGQVLSIRLQTARPITLDNVIVRVKDASKLAVHVDFDEANAALVTPDTMGVIVGQGCAPCAAGQAPAREKASAPAAKPAPAAGESVRGSAPNFARVVTEAAALALIASADGAVHLPRGAIVTPSALDVFRRTGCAVEKDL